MWGQRAEPFTAVLGSFVRYFLGTLAPVKVKTLMFMKDFFFTIFKLYIPLVVFHFDTILSEEQGTELPYWDK